MSTRPLVFIDISTRRLVFIGKLTHSLVFIGMFTGPLVFIGKFTRPLVSCLSVPQRMRHQRRHKMSMLVGIKKCVGGLIDLGYTPRESGKERHEFVMCR